MPTHQLVILGLLLAFLLVVVIDFWRKAKLVAKPGVRPATPPETPPPGPPPGA